MGKKIDPLGTVDLARQEAVSKILEAAAELFFKLGYERTTTLEIARVASVSKRTLYECFGTKQGILEALIRTGSKRMHLPLDLAAPETTQAFFETLREFGIAFLSELLSSPKVAMYRLAIADATRTGVVARQLEESGRGPVIEALQALFEGAMQKELIRFADPALVMPAFFGVLVGEVQMRLVMGTMPPLTRPMIRQRVDLAVKTVQHLCEITGRKPASSIKALKAPPKN